MLLSYDNISIFHNIPELFGGLEHDLEHDFPYTVLGMSSKEV
jgi:hypothetical protein